MGSGVFVSVESKLRVSLGEVRVMNLTEIYWLLHTYTNICDCSVCDSTHYLDLWGLKRVLSQ